MIIKLKSIFFTFLKIGYTSYGASTTEVIIETLVEEKKWLNIDDTKDSIAFASLTPGPFHINLVMSIGYQLRGYIGMSLTFIGYILPSLIIVYTLYTLFSADMIVNSLRENPGITSGITAGISGLLINAIIKLAKRDLFKSLYSLMFIIALVIATLFFKLPFFVVIIGTGFSFIIVNILKCFRN